MQARYDAFQRVIETINAEYECSLRMTCEACPVQVEGTIDSNGLYFRARWDAWRLVIAETVKQAIAAGRSTDVVFFHKSCAGIFDWEDDTTWEPAVQGIHAVYIAYQPDLTIPGAVEQIKNWSTWQSGQGCKVPMQPSTRR